MSIVFHKIKTWFKKTIEKKSNTNIFAMMFFIFLSTLFWFFININKTYIDTIAFPVKFENFPARKIQIGDLPRNLNLTIETNGYKILSYKIKTIVNPLKIDVQKSSIFPVSRKDSLKFYILIDLERNQILEQLSNEIRIMNISPDTILFHFDILKAKKIPVISQTEINCRQQYMKVGKTYLEPDSILLKGPSSILDTLHAIYTKPLILNDVKEPVNANLSLEFVQGVNAEKQKIRLIAEIDKYTETKIEVPVIAKNVPDSLQLKIFPGEITITCHVPFKIFENIHREDFQMIVDYNNIGPWSKDKLKVILEKKPENITILGWEPKNVEFIIEK